MHANGQRVRLAERTRAALTSALDRAAWLASAETIPDLSVLSFVGVSPAPATEKRRRRRSRRRGEPPPREGPGDPGGINAAGTGGAAGTGAGTGAGGGGAAGGAEGPGATAGTAAEAAAAEAGGGAV